jgi:hypothetical protein
MLRDEDNRSVDIRFGQLALEVQPTQPRQAHVEHQAAGHIRASALQELPRRREGLDRQPHRPEETLQRVAHRCIIINNEYHGASFGHDTFSPSAASVHCKMAACGECRVAHSRPPCALMMERLIASPIPMPSGFVV